MTICDDTPPIRVPNEGQALIEVPKDLGPRIQAWMEAEATTLRYQRQAAQRRAAFDEAQHLLVEAQKKLASAQENARFARQELIAAIEDHKQ